MMIMIRKMGRSLGFKELVIGGGEMIWCSYLCCETKEKALHMPFAL